MQLKSFLFELNMLSLKQRVHYIVDRLKFLTWMIPKVTSGVGETGSYFVITLFFQTTLCKRIKHREICLGYVEVPKFCDNSDSPNQCLYHIQS